MRFRAVFLDAGETMIYPHPSFPELFAHVLERTGHPVDPDDVLATVGAFSKRWGETVRAQGQKLWSVSREASRAFWLRLYREFLEELGVDGDRDRLAVRLYETFSDPASYRAYPDVLPALESLRARGYELGVISNFEDWLELVFEAAELTRYFPVRVISGIEGVEKPDPRIFEIALERAGVAPEESVYVGDHPVFDVDAARAVGMFAVLVDRRDRHPDIDAPRIAALTDLDAVLDTP